MSKLCPKSFRRYWNTWARDNMQLNPNYVLALDNGIYWSISVEPEPSHRPRATRFHGLSSTDSFFGELKKMDYFPYTGPINALNEGNRHAYVP